MSINEVREDCFGVDYAKGCQVYGEFRMSASERLVRKTNGDRLRKDATFSYHVSHRPGKCLACYTLHTLTARSVAQG